MKSVDSKAIKIFGRFLKSAKNISDNPEKIKSVFEKVDGHVESKKGPLGQIFVKTKLAGRMIQDYVKGDYKNLPYRTLLVLVGAALYIIYPLDAVFDFIPFIGFADDIFIFNLVYSQISKDLVDYLEWAENRQEEKSEISLEGGYTVEDEKTILEKEDLIDKD